MDNEEQKLPTLERALLEAMQAIDNQIARELQRSPAQREAHGVQKWAPIASRIERLTAFILNGLGGEEIQIDSVLVLSQSLTKALRMACEDLGEDGLGTVRTEYCLKAFEEIDSDAAKGRAILSNSTQLT